LCSTSDSYRVINSPFLHICISVSSQPQKIAMENEIIVFDHGLHFMTFNPKSTDYQAFVNDTKETLQAYREEQHASKVELLLWRETSAQHFPTDTGDFQLKIKDITECVPLHHNRTRSTKTRGVRKAAQEAGYRFLTLQEYVQNKDGGREESTTPRRITNDNNPTLVMLPFYEYTRKLLHLHAGECTHYCHSTDVWLPIFRGLRLALDHRYPSTQQ
jgi:hypothetical protein